jgi:hypothetical protein
MQNKRDFRNQRKKLHRIAYILSKNFFRRNSTCTPPQQFLLSFPPVVPYRSNFDGKIFLIKYRLSGANFYADFENRAYFAFKLPNNGQNVEI